MNWTCLNQKKNTLKNYIFSKHSTNLTLDDIKDVEILQDVMSIVECHIKNIESRGKTAMLWVQYFFLVHLLCRFICAERSGNWYAHLECVEKMIPFFIRLDIFNMPKQLIYIFKICMD